MFFFLLFHYKFKFVNALRLMKYVLRTFVIVIIITIIIIIFIIIISWLLR